jgi:hypothetical protein
MLGRVWCDAASQRVDGVEVVVLTFRLVFQQFIYHPVGAIGLRTHDERKPFRTRQDDRSARAEHAFA